MMPCPTIVKKGDDIMPTSGEARQRYADPQGIIEDDRSTSRSKRPFPRSAVSPRSGKRSVRPESYAEDGISCRSRWRTLSRENRDGCGSECAMTLVQFKVVMAGLDLT